MREVSRYLSIVISFAGIIFNYKVAVYIAAVCNRLKGQYQTIWEGPAGDVWRVDTISVQGLGGLLSNYSIATALACFVGFIGLAKPVPWVVRFYRNYSIVDCVSVTLVTLYSGFAISRPDVRARFCQEFSRHPELVHEFAEAGLPLETCELWFGHAILGLMGSVFIIILIRILVLVVLSKSLRLLSTGSLLPIHLPLASTSPPFTSFSFNHSDASTFTRSNDPRHDTPCTPVPVDGMTKRDGPALGLCDFTAKEPLVVLDHVGNEQQRRQTAAGADVVIPANRVELIEAGVAALAASTNRRAPPPSPTRIWHDRTGRMRVQAAFLGFSDDKIRLHKMNGVIIEVPPRKLSVEDLEYVQALAIGPALPRRTDDDDDDDDEPLESRRMSLLTFSEDPSR